MKKRIGTKLYDTDSATLVIPECKLYRKNRSFDFFYFDGSMITPVKFSEAENLLKKFGKTEYLQRKAAKDGFTQIGISAASADHLAAYCRENQVTQKKVIEDYIETLPVKEG